MCYDVYVNSTSDLSWGDYSVVDSTKTKLNFSTNPASPTSLGDGWTYLGTVTVSSASVTGLSMSYSDGDAPTAVCLVQEGCGPGFERK